MAKCWEGKKYKLEKSENFDEYMKELGKQQQIRIIVLVISKLS